MRAPGHPLQAEPSVIVAVEGPGTLIGKAAARSVAVVIGVALRENDGAIGAREARGAAVADLDEQVPDVAPVVGGGAAQVGRRRGQRRQEQFVKRGERRCRRGSHHRRRGGGYSEGCTGVKAFPGNYVDNDGDDNSLDNERASMVYEGP